MTVYKIYYYFHLKFLVSSLPLVLSFIITLNHIILIIIIKSWPHVQMGLWGCVHRGTRSLGLCCRIILFLHLKYPWGRGSWGFLLVWGSEGMYGSLPFNSRFPASSPRDWKGYEEKTHTKNEAIFVRIIKISPIRLVYEHFIRSWIMYR